MARNRIHNYLDKKRQQTCDRLWCEIVCDILERDLADKLSEPLDDPQFDDMDEETKRRVREAGF
jgi:hypothetical protein